MGLDPNIILGGQNKPIDPLAIAGQAVNLKNALITNQSNQQTLDARTALGPIYQGAIDPKTGRLDSNKLLIGAAGDPRTAWMAPDIAKGAQEREKGQIDIDQAAYNLKKQHIQTLQQAMAPLIANPNSTPQDYASAMANLVSQGLVQPDEAILGLQGMPQDPAQLHQWGIGHYTQLMDTDKQLDVLYGKAQQTDTGNVIQQYTVSPMTGVHPQGTFTKGMSPTDQAGTVATVGPNGEPGVISKGQYAAQSGIGQGGAYIPANGQPMDAMPPVAPNPPAASNGGAPHGFMPTGLAPGQTEALTDSATQGQGALKAGSDFRLNIRPLLTEAKNQLAQGVLTGPNADTAKLAGQFLSQIPGLSVPDGTPKQEILGKVLEQLAQRQAAILGGTPTDAKLASAQSATPNTHLSNAGLAGTLATVQGQGQAIDLLGQSYNAYLNTHPEKPVPFNQFKVQFTKDVDPYVLVLRSLPPKDMQDAFKAMTQKQRAAVQASSDKLDRLANAIGWQP